jgi:hypothetical protein
MMGGAASYVAGGISYFKGA